MKKLESFNVRCYAICESDEKILVLYEYHAGKVYGKLPGGGVEFGEGIIDCLHREFEEELNAKIEITEHFYTQEHFVESVIDDGRQLLFIYYLVRILNVDEMKINTSEINRFAWIDINEDPFLFPVDKIVLAKLRESKKRQC